MGTFRARGAGGVELELDDPDLSTPRGEIIVDQIRKGDLVVLDGDSALGGEADIDAFLAKFAPEPEDDAEVDVEDAETPAKRTRAKARTK